MQILICEFVIENHSLMGSIFRDMELHCAIRESEEILKCQDTE